MKFEIGNLNQKEGFWSLDVDYVNTWITINSFLSKEECNELIELGNKKCLNKAVTFSNNMEISESVRKSDISWIYSSDNPKIYRKIVDAIHHVNEKHYKFDLFGLSEGFQFTRYVHPEGKYGKHIDCCYNGIIRKLSISIQLSDPSEYEGGDFNFHFSDIPETAERELGNAIIFPSYMLHEVTPVTSGTRYSLVAWVTGKPFK